MGPSSQARTVAQSGATHSGPRAVARVAVEEPHVVLRGDPGQVVVDEAAKDVKGAAEDRGAVPEPRAGRHGAGDCTLRPLKGSRKERLRTVKGLRQVDEPAVAEQGCILPSKEQDSKVVRVEYKSVGTPR